MNNKGLIITLIVILTLIGIGLTTFMINLLGGNFKFSFGRVSEELIVDEVYKNNFQKLDISTDMSDTYVKISNDDTFRVVIYGDKERTNIDVKNSTLEIETKARKCFGFCFNQKASKVLVYVPESFAGEMEISNNFGDIDVEKLRNARMKIVAKAGDIEVEAADEVDIKNDYGDIRVDYVRTAKIRESCGEIEVGEVDYLEAKNDYGDVKVDKVTNYMSIDESCGDVKVGSVGLKSNSRIKNSFGKIEIGSTNEIYIDAEVDLGDIKINNNYREASVELKLENNCGDIRVNN